MLPKRKVNKLTPKQNVKKVTKREMENKEIKKALEKRRAELRRLRKQRADADAVIRALSAPKKKKPISRKK